MEKIFLVGNPCSGTMKLKNNLLEIVRIFSYAGYLVTVYPTKYRGDATEAVSKLSDEYSTIICCGGDGTLNEVISGIMLNKNSYKLGYIPAGTLNEWSSSLHISKNILTAAKDIVDGRVIPLDIGLFDNKFFTYTASFGAFTDASYSASQEVKNVLGQAAYFFQGIKSLGNIKPYHITFMHDDMQITGDFLFGAITNSLSVGGIIKLDESQVKLNDGMFEVLLIRKPSSVAKLNGVITGILTKDFSSPCFEFFKTNELGITTETPFSWTLDGEEGTPSSCNFTIKNLRSAISFYVPNKK